MLDLIFTIGQTASALLLLYGAVLTLMPARHKQHTLGGNQAPFLERQAHGAD